MSQRARNKEIPASRSIPVREYWIPLAASLVMVVYCVVASPQRNFWNDELFSWFFLSDPSFAHMMEAFHDKLNNTPALYFVLGWGWAQAFGAGELSLRLFSCLGFCVALSMIWLVLRRNFSAWPAAIGTLGIFCTSSLVLEQIREARMYGLFMAVAAAGLLLYDATGRHKLASGKWILFTFLVHSALIHTHLFGMFYSAALLGATLLRDMLRKSWNPLLYGAALAGCATFIFYYPAFVVQADAGVPRSWIPPSGFRDLKSFLLLKNQAFLTPTIFNILAVWLILRHWVFKHVQNQKDYSSEVYQSRASLRIVCLFFLAVPIGIWFISLLIRPLYVERYMLPTTLGLAILLAFLIDLLLFSERPTPGGLSVKRWRSVSPRWNNQYFPALLTVLLLVNPLRNLWRTEQAYNQDDFLAIAEDYPGLPVVVQHSNWFQEILFYAPPENRQRYFFILDKESASLECSGPYSLQEYKHLDAFKRQYPDYFQGQVLTSEEFLSAHPEFLVIDYPEFAKKCPLKARRTPQWWFETHCPQWLDLRILDNPAYQAHVLRTGYEPPATPTFNTFALLHIQKACSGPARE